MVRRFEYVGGSYPIGEREDGDYVEYDDYAALESRLTAIISGVQSELDDERKLRLADESRLAELEKFKEAWDPVISEVERRAWKECCLQEKCDFTVIVDYVEYVNAQTILHGYEEDEA